MPGFHWLHRQAGVLGLMAPGHVPQYFRQCPIMLSRVFHDCCCPSSRFWVCMCSNTMAVATGVLDRFSSLVSWPLSLPAALVIPFSLMICELRVRSAPLGLPIMASTPIPALSPIGAQSSAAPPFLAGPPVPGRILCCGATGKCAACLCRKVPVASGAPVAGPATCPRGV